MTKQQGGGFVMRDSQKKKERKKKSDYPGGKEDAEINRKRKKTWRQKGQGGLHRTIK